MTGNDHRDQPEGYSERYPKEPLSVFLGLDRENPWRLLFSLVAGAVVYFGAVHDQSWRIAGAVFFSSALFAVLALFVYR
ncbi:MAG: hypothetical protein WBB15_16315 [Ornithinimicrobium sp.]